MLYSLPTGGLDMTRLWPLCAERSLGWSWMCAERKLIIKSLSMIGSPIECWMSPVKGGYSMLFHCPAQHNPQGMGKSWYGTFLVDLNKNLGETMASTRELPDSQWLPHSWANSLPFTFVYIYVYIYILYYIIYPYIPWDSMGHICNSRFKLAYSRVC